MLALPPLVWLETAARQNHHQPKQVLDEYIKLVYAREFARAYQVISLKDRRLKTKKDYVLERGPFTGFTLEVARKLAGLIETHVVAEQQEGSRRYIRVALKLPDANAISELMIDWDEQRLDALTALEQRKILATLDSLSREKKLAMIEGEEQFVLVRENSRWKIYLDWATGVTVNFATALPPRALLAAEPTIRETVVRSGDLFTVGFKVKNRGPNTIVTRIVHRIEPSELAPYLDLVECSLLLPVRLVPGEEQIFNSTYVLRGDLPDGAKALDVTYEFQFAN